MHNLEVNGSDCYTLIPKKVSPKILNSGIILKKSPMLNTTRLHHDVSVG